MPQFLESLLLTLSIKGYHCVLTDKNIVDILEKNTFIAQRINKSRNSILGHGTLK